MVNFPPLAPSVRWWREWFRSLKKGYSENDAICCANSTLNSTKPFGRFIVFDKQGNRHCLSMAVEGGGRLLRKYELLSNLNLSEHGEWRKNHLRTLEAILGKNPFYLYIMEILEPIYNDVGINTMIAFNTSVFNLLRSFLFKDISPEYIMDYKDDVILKERGEELRKEIDEEESILKPLTKFGKESILILM